MAPGRWTYAFKQCNCFSLPTREREIMEPIIEEEIGHFGKVTKAERNGLLLSSSSRMLSRILSTYEGNQNWENIDVILSSPRFACNLIAGLWDADGGVYRERSGQLRIHLYNSDLRLLDEIAESLYKVYAIETALYKRPANSPESRILTRSDRFDLYVIASSNATWVRTIGTRMFLPWKKA